MSGPFAMPGFQGGNSTQGFNSPRLQSESFRDCRAVVRRRRDEGGPFHLAHSGGELRLGQPISRKNPLFLPKLGKNFLIGRMK